MASKVMDRTGAPGFLWYMALVYVVYLLNHVAMDSLGGITPIQACYGYTPDISPLLQYHFYQPVLYSRDNTSFPNSPEDLGHWIGVAENKGDVMTSWVLTDNQKMLARSLVRPADDPKEPNRRPGFSPLNEHDVPNPRPDPSSPATESGQFPFQGSNEPGPKCKLDLLSDMRKGKMPNFDPTDVIGYSFVRHDAKNVPTKTTVMEVDDDTGKILLEYVHGGMEWVEPNIVQEAMLSHQDDAADEDHQP